MGWFGGDSSGGGGGQQATPAAIPTRSARQQCWNARDAYFGCLTDKQIIVPPGTEMGDGRAAGAKLSAEEREKLKEKEQKRKADREQDPCLSQRDTYEANCAQSWIDYFNKRRVLEERQRLMYAQGKAPIGSGPAPGAR